MGRGKGFRTSRGAKAGGASRETQSNIDAAQRELGAATNITEQSRQEFQERLDKGDPTNVRSEILLAQAGETPKFKFRQKRKEQVNLLQDRPGRAQTLLTS